MLVSIILALILFSISYIGVKKYATIEKVSAYECGFDPFEDARSKFDVRFYLVAYIIYNI
jgi:NADH:ubiquinone oxidoreductase subunit 3 (subunit A)